MASATMEETHWPTMDRPDSVSSEERITALEARLERAALAVDSSQASKLKERVRELDKALDQASQGRHDLGFELARRNLELDRLGTKLSKEEAEKQKIEHEKLYYKEKSSGLHLDLKRTDEQRKRAEEEAGKRQVEIEGKDAEILALKKVSLAYAEDVKIHHTVEGALDKQLSFYKAQLAQANLKVKDLQRNLQAADLKVKTAVDEKEAQKQEAASLRTLADRLARETEELKGNNDKVLVQWKSAMSALSHRDEVLSQVQTRSVEDRDRIADVLSKKMDEVVGELTDKLERERAEKERQKEDITNKTAELLKKESEIRTLTEAYRKETERRIRAEQEASDAKSSLKDKVVEERDRGNTKAVRLQSKIEGLKEKLSSFEAETEKGGQHMAAQIRRLAEDLEEQKQAFVKDLSEAESSQNLAEARLVEANAKVEELSEKNRNLQRQNDLLRIAQRDVLDQSSLAEQMAEREESHALRSEQAAAKMKMKLEALEKEGKTEVVLLKRDVEEWKQRYAALQDDMEKLKRTFIASQHELLASHKQVGEMAEMKSNMVVMEHAESKLRSKVKRIEKDAVESMKEASCARLEEQKAKAQLEREREEKFDLLVKLREAEMERAGLIEMVSNEYNALKQEIFSLRQARTEVVKVAKNTEYERDLLESKYAMAKQVVQQKMREGYEAEREIYTLNSKVRYLSRRRKEDVKSMDAIAKHYEKTMAKKLSARPAIAAVTGKISDAELISGRGGESERVSSSLSTASKGVAATSRHPHQQAGGVRAEGSNVSLASQDESVSALSMNTYSVKPEMSEKSDIFSEINKAKSQLAESQAENIKLTNRFEQVAQSFIALDQKFSSVNQQNYNLNRELQLVKSEVMEMTNRCLRAEGIAASLERQIRDVLPAYEIDYQYRPEVEPSPTLLVGFAQWQNGVMGGGGGAEGMARRGVQPPPLKLTANSNGDAHHPIPPSSGSNRRTPQSSKSLRSSLI